MPGNKIGSARRKFERHSREACYSPKSATASSKSDGHHRRGEELNEVADGAGVEEERLPRAVHAEAGLTAGFFSFAGQREAGAGLEGGEGAVCIVGKFPISDMAL